MTCTSYCTVDSAAVATGAGMACTAGGACSKTAVGGSKLNCGMPRQDPGADNDHPSPTPRKQSTYYRSALGLRDRCGGGGAGRLGQGMRGALLVAHWLAVEKTRVLGGAPHPRDAVLFRPAPAPHAVICLPI